LITLIIATTDAPRRTDGGVCGYCRRPSTEADRYARARTADRSREGPRSGRLGQRRATARPFAFQMSVSRSRVAVSRDHVAPPSGDDARAPRKSTVFLCGSAAQWIYGVGTGSRNCVKVGNIWKLFVHHIW